MENGRPAAYVTGVWRSVSPPNTQTSYNGGFVLPCGVENEFVGVESGLMDHMPRCSARVGRPCL